MQSQRKRFSSLPDFLQDFVPAFAWNHAAKLSEYILLYIFSIIVARSLVPGANGIYATLISISQLLLTFSSVALDLTINRFLPQISDPHKDSKIVFLVRRLVSLKFILFFICSLALIFCWSEVQHWFDVQSPVTGYLIFVVALGFVRAISTSVSSVWISRLESKAVFIVNVGTLLLQVAAALFVIGKGHELNAFLLIAFFGSALSVTAYVILGREFITAPGEKIPMKPVFSFTGWLWINAITTYIYGKQGDIMMLSFFSVSKTSVGCYDVAYSLSFLPSFAFAAGLGGISVSMFSRLAKEQPTGIGKFWEKLSSLLTQITVPVYCFLALFAGNIVTLLYTDAYAESAQLLQIFIAARILSRLFSGGESFDALLNLNAEKAAVKIGMIGAAINFLLNLILIPRLHAYGAVLATSITIVVVDVSTWILLKRRTFVPLLWNNWMRSLLVGIVPVFLMRVIFPFPSFSQLMLSAAFCILMWITGIFFVVQRKEMPRA